MSQPEIPRGAQMYVMCLNVSHVSKLARYARESHRGDRKVHQCTASVKALCHMYQSSLATLASSTVGTARCINVQRVSKHARYARGLHWEGPASVKARSLRSRTPLGGPEGQMNGAFNRGISERNCKKSAYRRTISSGESSL